MSTCAMMMLTVIGVPLAAMGLVMLYKAASAYVASLQLQVQPAFRRLAPAMAVVVPAALVALAIGYGWQTSVPCGGASAANAMIAPVQATACMASR